MRTRPNFIGLYSRETISAVPRNVQTLFAARGDSSSFASGGVAPLTWRLIAPNPLV